MASLIKSDKLYLDFEPVIITICVTEEDFFVLSRDYAFHCQFAAHIIPELVDYLLLCFRKGKKPLQRISQ